MAGVLKTLNYKLCTVGEKDSKFGFKVDKKSLQKVLSSEKFQKDMANRYLFGFISHQDRMDMDALAKSKRLPYQDVVINSGKVANILYDVHFADLDGKEVFIGKVDVLDTVKGHDMASAMDAGTKMKVSLSTLASPSGGNWNFTAIRGVDFTTNPAFETEEVPMEFSDGKETELNLNLELEEVDFSDDGKDKFLHSWAINSIVDRGLPINDVKEFIKLGKEDGYDLTEQDYQKYLEYCENIKLKNFSGDDWYEKAEKAINEVLYHSPKGTKYNIKDYEKRYNESLEKGDKEFKSFIKEWYEKLELDKDINFSAEYDFAGIRDYIIEQVRNPRQVFLRRFNQVVQYLQSTSPEKVQQNYQYITQYLREYMLQWINNAISNAKNTTMSIMMGLGLGNILRDSKHTKTARDLQRILVRIRSALNSSGTMTPKMQKDLNKAFNDLMTAVMDSAIDRAPRYKNVATNKQSAIETNIARKK